MKKYTPIHVGTRWATEHTWGVMVEGVGRPGAELLCVGCTQGQAEGMAAKLNGVPPPRPAVKVAAVAPQSYTDVLEARRARQTLGKDTDAA